MSSFLKCVLLHGSENKWLSSCCQLRRNTGDQGAAITHDQSLVHDVIFFKQLEPREPADVESVAGNRPDEYRAAHRAGE